MAILEAPGNWIGRGLGLMFRRSLAEGHGIILEPCSSVHMFFMRFPLDLVFLDRERRVKRLVENLRPWRVSPIVLGARAVVEVPAGTIARTGITAGEMLTLHS
ncbi:MAG: DUF192 domain-containing protein [Candidatus Dormibacteria bacterium]